MVYSKSFRVSRADKFMNFVMFLMLGPFILMLNTIVDVYYFVRHMLIRDMFKTTHKITGDRQISKQNLAIMADFFRQKSEKLL